jgi:hypothetical protein
MNRQSPPQAHEATAGDSRWDTWGQVLSVLCMAHCLLLPLVLSALPTLMTRFLEQAPIHLGVVALASIIGLLSFVPGFRRHQDWRVPALGAAGLTVLGLAHTLHEGPAETAVTVMGGAMLLVAHGLNRRRCQDGCAGTLRQAR